MNRRMKIMAASMISLVVLGSSLLVHWVSLAMGGPGLSLVQGILSFLGFGVFHAGILPLSRRSVRARGLARVLSRSWILISLALVLTGILLAVVFTLVAGGGAFFLDEAQVRAAGIWLGAASVVLSFGAIAWGASVGNFRVRVDRVSLPLRNASGPVEALRIVHVTDLHIGPLLRAARLRRFVDRINALEPDLIVLTGDLFDFDPVFVEEGCRELDRLRGRLGVYAVLGNHDVYTGRETVAEGLSSLTEVRLLRDSWETIDVDGAPFAIAGIEDTGEGWTERDSRSPALVRLADEIPRDLPCLLLSHRPSYFLHAAELGFSLVLAGHTHGGQVALPMAHNHNPSRMIADRTRGIWRSGDATLYVNRGLGMAGLSLRLNCPREIALIQLVGQA